MKWLRGIWKIETQQDYLFCLGRYLLWRLPFSQVREILGDYREYFSAETGGDAVGEEPAEKRGESPETEGLTGKRTASGVAERFTEKVTATGEIGRFMDRWGTPREVAEKLLEENPPAGVDRRALGTGLWGLLLLVSFYGLFFGKRGLLLSLLLWGTSAFGLLHGRERLELERELKKRKGLPGGALAIHGLLPPLAMLLEAAMQYLLWQVQNTDIWLPVSVGRAVDSVCLFCQLLFGLLFLWLFIKTAVSSMLYISLAVHTCGAMLFVRGIRGCLHSMNLSTGYEGQDFLYALGYYGASLALAVLFVTLCRVWGPAQGKRG